VLQKKLKQARERQSMIRGMQKLGSMVIHKLGPLNSPTGSIPTEVKLPERPRGSRGQIAIPAPTMFTT
jgi:hypothetical protein